MASPTPLLRINEAELAKLPESERKAFEADLAKLKHALEQNPLNAYFPHPRQREFHEATTKIKAFIAGNRSGKTKGGIADDLIQCLDSEWVPSHLRPYKKWEPPFRCRIIVPDFTRTMDAVMEHLRDMCPRGTLRGGGFDKAYDKANRVLHFANGSLIDLMTYEQDIDKFGGVSRDRIHYDEEPPEEIRTASAKRLIDTGGDELFTFTPEKGISWTKDRIYERRHEPDVTVIQAGMRDNPHLGAQEIDYLLSLIPTEEEREIAEKGEYAAIGGTFYPEFRDRHLTDPPSKKHLKAQTVVVGIDPGYRTTAVIWIAFDNDNSALVFDELYTHNAVSDQIAPKIRERNEFWSVEPRYVIDPSARNMATVNADQVEASFARAGIYCAHGQNSRPSGITEVKRRLQNDLILISKECVNLRKEFPAYRRDPKGVDEWQAIKENDHGLDAMRYALMERAWNQPSPKTSDPEARPWNYVGPYKTSPVEPPPLGAYS